MSVSREKLYEEVWAEPMTTVAERYDVSSSFLARICEQLNVPRPPRGHWAQLKVGRPKKRPPLAEARPGDELEWTRGGERARPAAVPRTPVLRKRSKKLEQPDRHPLLDGAVAHFLHSRVSTYDDEKYLRPYKRNLVDVLCSKDALHGALDAASALFLGLERRGHRVILAPSDARYSRMRLSHREGEKRVSDEDYRYGGRGGPAKPTLAFIDTVAIGLTVFELSEYVEVRYVGGESKYLRVGSPEERKLPRRPNEWTTQQWLVSGRLGVHAYAPYHAIRWERYWRENKPGELLPMFATITKELEGQAPAIVALLEKEARDAEERGRKWEIERREMERKEDERRRVEREAQREKEIVGTISNWRLARDVREYVAEIYSLVKDANLELTEDGGAERELKWALAYADRVDPLTIWRKDIEKVKAEAAGKPCPDCGKIHDAESEGGHDEPAID
ncbi:MAG TPA: hypothetical protein VHW01_25025, partial [Polyangiaceae bacterium]|nr:hypothetical protein [Polyangiaceae bacterium]